MADIKSSAKELCQVAGLKFKDEKDFLTKQPIFFDENQIWWLWRGDRYEVVDHVSIENFIFDSMRIILSNQLDIEVIMSRLKNWTRLNKPKNLPPYSICFKNLIFDLKNRKEIPSTFEYFITAPISYNLSDFEETPVIDSLFESWVGSGYVKTLYEILAYACLNEQFLQTIIALCGAGANGKGTYQNLMRKFLGDTNVVSSSVRSIVGRPFETSALYKKPLCVIGEVDTRDLTNTNLIKQLTGEDLIRYEFKGKTPFSEISPTTFVVATNSLPRTPDKSVGFYRRWLIVDFPNQFTVNRKLLENIPEKEFENLTRKVVNTALELMEKEEFTNGGTIEERRKRYESRSNPLMQFINLFFKETQGFYPLKDFAKSYNFFLQKNNLRPETVHNISRILREEGFEISTRKYRDGDGEIVDSAKSIIGLISSDDSNNSNSTSKTTQTTDFDYRAKIKKGNNDINNFSTIEKNGGLGGFKDELEEKYG